MSGANRTLRDHERDDHWLRPLFHRRQDLTAQRQRLAGLGEIGTTFDVFELPGEPGLSICTYSVEEASPSADKFALLASWAATQEFGNRHRHRADLTHDQETAGSAPPTTFSAKPVARSGCKELGERLGQVCAVHLVVDDPEAGEDGLVEFPADVWGGTEPGFTD